MISINLNPAAASAQTSLSKANEQFTLSMQRLSSGDRIIDAKDDVAGLAVGTSLQANVSILEAASINISQAQSLGGIADGALSEMGNILQRQTFLAEQAASGALDSNARDYLDQEFQELTKEIDRIADNTNFNGLNLLDGSDFNSAVDFQVGTSTSDTISIQIDAQTASDLGIDGDDLQDQNNANTALDNVKDAIGFISQARANIGASMSRFDTASSVVETNKANQDAARGVFLDADMAKTSTDMAASQVKEQASISVLAQANQSQQQLLKLIG